MKPSVEFK